MKSGKCPLSQYRCPFRKPNRDVAHASQITPMFSHTTIDNNIKYLFSSGIERALIFFVNHLIFPIHSRKVLDTRIGDNFPWLTRQNYTKGRLLQSAAGKSLPSWPSAPVSSKSFSKYLQYLYVVSAFYVLKVICLIYNAFRWSGRWFVLNDASAVGLLKVKSKWNNKECTVC